MAENSPMKRTRSQLSPRKHPYDRKVKSPLQAAKGENNTGEYALFPASKHSKHQDEKTGRWGGRHAMGEMSNVISRPKKETQRKEELPKPSFGVIGENRRSNSLMGFIPVEKSCTIGIGGNGNNLSASRFNSNPSLLVGDGKGRVPSFTYHPQGMIENEPEDLTKSSNIRSLLYEPMYKPKVHSKTFHPPTTAPAPNTSFSIYESPPQVDISHGEGEWKSFSFQDLSQANDSTNSERQSRHSNSFRMPLSDISLDSEQEDNASFIQDNELSVSTKHQDNFDTLPCNTEILRFEQESRPKKFFTSHNPYRSLVAKHGYLPEANIPRKKPDKSQEISPIEPPNNLETLLCKNDENSVQKPFSSASTKPSLTSGILGQLQPKGLNTSFTEKFVSSLGINSGEQQQQNTSQRARHGPLTEKFIPLFDFPEYCIDILKYWSRCERKMRPKSNYMLKQTEITFRMRTILVNWIAEVSSEYNLAEQTLHLAVNYVDRFLGEMNVKREKLQLVGTTAMFIAAKFEETQPPEITDFVYVTDGAYRKEQVIQMERFMLNTLDYDLMVPTAHDFAVSYCSIMQLEHPIRCLSMYLVDLALLEAEIYLRYLPSVIATAAVCISRYSFDQGIYWDDEIQRLSTHRRKKISDCARHLHNSFFAAPENQQMSALFEKYQSVRFCSISQAFIPACGPWMEKEK